MFEVGTKLYNYRQKAGGSSMQFDFEIRLVLLLVRLKYVLLKM